MSQTVSTTPHHDWALAALDALHQRQQTAQATTAAPTVLARPPPRSGPALAVPKGAKAPITPWGKYLFGNNLFGTPSARAGTHPSPADPKLQIKDGDDDDTKAAKKDAQEERQRVIDKSADFKRRIDDQHKLGTAATVEIPSAGKRKLKGNFFNAASQQFQNGKPDTSRPVVLYLSGSGGTAEDQSTDVAEFYQDSGASVLAANYGGYGDSTPGRPGEESLLQDSQAMLQHLLDLGYQPEQIIIHGYSMGGAIGGMLQEHNDQQGIKLRGLVLDRPMLSSTAGVKGKLGMGDKLDTVAAGLTRLSLGSMSARKAIMGGASDTRAVVTSDESTTFQMGADKKPLKDAAGKKIPKPNDFAQGAETFRAALTQKGGRAVTGQQSGEDHFDNEAMLKKNASFLSDLVNNPNPGSTDAALPDTRSEHEKATRAGLSKRISARISQASIDLGNLSTHFYTTLAADTADQPLSDQNKLKYRTAYEAIEAQANDLLEESTEFSNAPMGVVSDTDKTFVAQNSGSASRSLQSVLTELMRLGAPVTLNDNAVPALIAPVRQFKTAILDPADPASFTGSTPVETAFLRQYWPKIEFLEQANSRFVSADLTLIRDMKQFKADIDARVQQAQQPQQPQPPVQSSSSAAPLPVNPGWRTSSTNSTGSTSRRGSMLSRSRRGSGST